MKISYLLILASLFLNTSISVSNNSSNHHIEERIDEFLYKVDDIYVTKLMMDKIIIASIYFNGAYPIYQSDESIQQMIYSNQKSKIITLINLYKDAKIKVTNKKSYSFLRDICKKNKISYQQVINSLESIGSSEEALLITIKLNIAAGNFMKENYRRSFHFSHNSQQVDFIEKIRKKDEYIISKINLFDEYLISESINKNILYNILSKKQEITNPLIGISPNLYNKLLDSNLVILNNNEYSKSTITQSISIIRMAKLMYSKYQENIT